MRLRQNRRDQHGTFGRDRLGADRLAMCANAAREAVLGELTEAGLSTRAIAPVVGVSARTAAYGAAAVQPCTPDQGETEQDYPAPVTGLDGKSYRRPASVSARPESSGALAASLRPAGLWGERDDSSLARAWCASGEAAVELAGVGTHPEQVRMPLDAQRDREHDRVVLRGRAHERRQGEGRRGQDTGLLEAVGRRADCAGQVVSVIAHDRSVWHGRR